LGAAVAGIMLSIGAFLGIFITISWPLLIGGLVVGGVLSGLGVWKFATLKQRLAERFARVFLPKIKDALIGAGYRSGRQDHPSLREQLINHIMTTAAAVERELCNPEGKA
jgi:hypothetical protein